MALSICVCLSTTISTSSRNPEPSTWKTKWGRFQRRQHQRKVTVDCCYETDMKDHFHSLIFPICPDQNLHAWTVLGELVVRQTLRSCHRRQHISMTSCRMWHEHVCFNAIQHHNLSHEFKSICGDTHIWSPCVTCTCNMLLGQLCKWTNRRPSLQ